MRGFSCSARDAVEVATRAARATSASVGCRSASIPRLPHEPDDGLDDTGRGAQDGCSLEADGGPCLARDQRAGVAIDRAELADQRRERSPGAAARERERVRAEDARDAPRLCE